MKKVSLLLIAAAFVSSAFAQEGLGIEAGINSNQIQFKDGNDIDNSDSKIGLRAGLTYAIPVTNNLYLKPGAFYSNKGGQETELGISYKWNLNYIEIPVNLGYRFSFGNAGAIFAEAGPYVAYAISGKHSLENSGGKIETDIDFGNKVDEMKPFDWGFNIGAGYETPWKVYLKAQYGLGLGNLSNASATDTKISNRGWNVSVGYNF